MFPPPRRRRGQNFRQRIRYPLYGKITINASRSSPSVVAHIRLGRKRQHSRETITYGFGSDAVSTSVAEFYNGKDPLTDLPYKTCTGTDLDPSGEGIQRFRLQGRHPRRVRQGSGGSWRVRAHGRLGRAFVAIRHHRIPRHDGVRGVCGGGGRSTRCATRVHDQGRLGHVHRRAAAAACSPHHRVHRVPRVQGARGKDRLLYAQTACRISSCSPLV